MVSKRYERGRCLGPVASGLADQFTFSSRGRRLVPEITSDAELRRLIREGFESGIPGEQLAEAAGLSVPRVDQIRDGRP
jgi:hypothetical protein